jgi:hypothetical protein
MKIVIKVLRWTARIIGLLAILLFVGLFILDSFPIFLFSVDDSPEHIFHMWALLAMLIGLGLGWKWEGLAAAVVLGFFAADTIVLGVTYSLQNGLVFALIIVLSMLSFPFVLIPLCGLFYLICWAWEKFVPAPA